MRGWIIGSLLLLLVSQMAAGRDAVIKAAARYVPGFNWQAKSIVTGGLTCGDHKQTAILGTNQSEIVVAVFLNGTNKRPEVIHDRSRRQPASVTLTIEDLDYEVNCPLPGFQRSKTCKGLMIDNGETDPAHMYRDHESLHVYGWSN